MPGLESNSSVLDVLRGAPDVETVLREMNAHQNDSQLQKVGCEALSELAESDDNKSVILEKGGA